MNTIDSITVRGANEHNLKNVSVKIPHNKITVITGLSGSGKSSLAFDTIYAEGQRRYIESVSAYAKNFLQQLKKPSVDSISGLTPSLAIEQKTNSTSPRSTVGTVTEIYDYLRLLFAKIGKPHCPEHKTPMQGQSEAEILEEILKLKPNTKFFLLAPMAQEKKGEFHNEFERWTKLGFSKAKVDGEYIDLATAKKLAKTKKHNIDILIDRLIIKDSLIQRIKDSIKTALDLSGGSLAIELVNPKEKTTNEKSNRKVYSIHQSCSQCRYSFPKIDHRTFSFNNPRGACEECNGLGYVEYEYEYQDENEEDLDSEFVKEACPECDGKRLKAEILSILIGDKNIHDLADLSAIKLLAAAKKITLTAKQKTISGPILKQLSTRLEYMTQVGVGYLSTNRRTNTLSGGEAQRIRLATQIGASLVGVLYVMDEPSIGLHPRDHHRLLKIITKLKDMGNTIVMVEHDEDTINAADFIIDLGPLAGVNGGNISAQGTPAKIKKSKDSLTGLYLSGKKSIPLPNVRRAFNKEKTLSITKASGNNLKNVNLTLPLENLIVVSGVSGSGKSTLIIDTLFKALNNKLNKSSYQVMPFEKLDGLKHIDKIIEINQKAIGRTPRSNPATYVGILPLVRQLYAALPESRMRGYGPGRFSFNVKGGRCESCQGAGMIKVEMHFIANVFVPCDVCNSKRYNRETLNVIYNEKNISDILNMTVAEALEFFKNHKHIHKKLETLHRVGLDYITLGQSATTLSGGEAQRIKLSKELAKRSTGKTLYILDEPTTGLHFHDIAKLIDLLQELTDQKNTVVIIEHNLDVIKSADHVIDIGPEGGEDGGQILATGTPESIAKNKKSITGQFLKTVL